MLVKLPRLPGNLQIADSQGKPMTAFSRWWDNAMHQIEDNLNAVIAAQSTADAANSAASDAQNSANDANTAIAGLGTAANADTGTSGHTLPFLDGNNTFSGANTFGVVAASDATASRLHLPALQNALNDAAASAAGVLIGEVYRNGSQLMVRVT
jgi:hypothetical protein